MYRRSFLLSGVAAVAAIIAARVPAFAQAGTGAAPGKPQIKDPENTLIMTLKNGDVYIELFPDVAPKTVAQIKTLTRQGFYDGTPFHRVIEGFMAQGGDPTGSGSGGSKLPNVPAEFNNRHFVRGVARWPAPVTRTAATASSSSCSPRRPRWTDNTPPGGA